VKVQRIGSALTSASVVFFRSLPTSSFSLRVLPVKVQRIGSAFTSASVVLFIVCLRPHSAYVLPVKVPRISSASTSASVALFRVCLLRSHSAYTCTRPAREGSANRFSVDFGVRCTVISCMKKVLGAVFFGRFFG